VPRGVLDERQRTRRGYKRWVRRQLKLMSNGQGYAARRGGVQHMYDATDAPRAEPLEANRPASSLNSRSRSCPNGLRKKTVTAL